MVYDADWVMDPDGYHMHYAPSGSDEVKISQLDFINGPGEVYYDWFEKGQSELERAKLVAESTIVNPAKNVIIFVGDGLGVSTVTAARILRSQERNLVEDDVPLSFERMPHVGLSKTYATDQIVADSANTATALLTGHKCRDSVLGATARVEAYNCSTLYGNEVKSILDYSIDEGKWTGVVTTTRLTHATPAASYAKSSGRDFETDQDVEDYCIGPNCETCEDIAHQLIYGEYSQQIRVILGGGRSKFLSTNETDPEYPDISGERGDENLFDAYFEQKREMGVDEDKVFLAFNKEEFDNVDETTAEYMMGVFEPGHMKYVVDKSVNDTWDEPSLAEMVEKAINMLSRKQEGYFLLVEGGRIDHAHHDNRAHKALQETISFQDAVEKAMEMTDEQDTLIISTADHSHVFTMAGYGVNNHDILTYDDSTPGKIQVGTDGKPYTTLGYTNGPGFVDHRTNGNDDDQPRLDLSTLTSDQIRDKDFRYDAGIPRSSETHAGEDVAIYARGPMAHLVHGTHEQNYVAHLMMYASCVGPNQQLCETPPTVPPTTGSADRIQASFISVLTFVISVLLGLTKTGILFS